MVGNNIKDAGAVALAQALDSGQCQLTSLDLRGVSRFPLYAFVLFDGLDCREACTLATCVDHRCDASDSLSVRSMECGRKWNQ